MGEQRDCASLTEFQVSPLLSGVHTLILVKSLTRHLTIRPTRLQKLLPKAVGGLLFPGDPLEEAQDRGHLFPSWFGDHLTFLPVNELSKAEGNRCGREGVKMNSGL